MFSSIFNNFESFVEMWQKPDDSDIQHNFSEGVRVHNLPAAEPGPTCPLRTEVQFSINQDLLGLFSATYVNVLSTIGPRIFLLSRDYEMVVFTKLRRMRLQENKQPKL